MRKYKKHDHAEIWKLRQAGHSVRAIAALLSCARGSVEHVIRKNKPVDLFKEEKPRELVMWRQA